MTLRFQQSGSLWTPTCEPYRVTPIRQDFSNELHHPRPPPTHVPSPWVRTLSFEGEEGSLSAASVDHTGTDLC